MVSSHLGELFCTISLMSSQYLYNVCLFFPPFIFSSWVPSWKRVWLTGWCMPSYLLRFTQYWNTYKWRRECDNAIHQWFRYGCVCLFVVWLVVCFLFDWCVCSFVCVFGCLFVCLFVCLSKVLLTFALWRAMISSMALLAFALWLAMICSPINYVQVFVSLVCLFLFKRFNWEWFYWTNSFEICILLGFKTREIKNMSLHVCKFWSKFY